MNAARRCLAMRLTPIQRDGVVFLGALAALLAGIWLAVSFGVTFAGPSLGIAGWAVALLVVLVVAFAVSVFLWYYIGAEEREPARGEFVLDGQRHVHAGEGSYRTKAPGPGVVQEPEYRMSSDPQFVPRTVPRWLAWFGLMLVALLVSAALVSYSRTVEDPLSPLLVATGLLGGAVMLGALGVGEMSHEGPWTRKPG